MEAYRNSLISLIEISKESGQQDDVQHYQQTLNEVNEFIKNTHSR